jgi:hypothetical protein
MLWSLYEAKVLDNAGSAKAIIRAVGLLEGLGKVTLEPFHTAIEYFSNRYYDGTNLTLAFNELRFNSNDCRPLVESVVQGQSTDEVKILSAILIIVMRLRHNLFHGSKWSYGHQARIHRMTF